MEGTIFELIFARNGAGRSRTHIWRALTILKISPEAISWYLPNFPCSHPDVLLVRHAIRGAGMRDEPLRTSACETTTRILTYRNHCLAHRFSS